jgi:hypothetical protein
VGPPCTNATRARLHRTSVMPNPHLSPTVCCIVGWDRVYCVTLGRPPQRISLDTPPVASVASLAAPALSAVSPRKPVRDAGWRIRLVGRDSFAGRRKLCPEVP